MSETLREEEGHDQIAEEEYGDDESDEVLCAHSRSTAFRMRNATRKNASVRTR
jgi:hypothetical protein